MLRLFGLVLPVTFLSLATAGENWPQFRGPTGDGVSDAVGLPFSWSEDENVAWKTPIHDHGWSSPVVWDGQVWVTTATEDGTRLFAVCLDRDSGRVVHDVEVFQVAEPGKIAVVNSYASPTPVLEDGRLYVHFGTYGTACLDTQTGQTKWARRDLNCDHHMGPGASPILYGELLIFTVDGCDVQYVVALDKETGETVWKTNRTVDLSDVHYMTRKCFGTPTVYSVGDRCEMITPASRALLAYDPRTGEELWKLRHRGWSISPRPIYHQELLYAVMDFDHPELWAIEPGGDGERDTDVVAWSLRKGAPSTPSFLLSGNNLFAVSDDGIAICLDAKSGETIWRERLGGNFSASPVLAENRVYFFSRDAVTTVVGATRSYNRLAENRLDGQLRASPAVVGNSLLVRTKTHLYRIENAAPEAAE